MAKLRLKHDVALWEKKDAPDRGLYAFPLGAPTPWGGPFYVDPGDAQWVARGVLPRWFPVESVVPDKGHRVRATLGRATAYTADWAVEADDDEGGSDDHSGEDA